MLEQFRQQWQSSVLGRRFVELTRRDQLAVLGLAVFFGLLLVYLVIWQPVSDWNASADGRYLHQLSVLDWMRSHESDARAAARQATSGQRGGNSMLSVVSSTAEGVGVVLTRFQPEGGGGVSVVIQNQDFGAVMRWIDELARKRINVRQLSIDQQGQPGRINARINLI